MLYFLWKYYLQCTLALQKKKNYDEKMMVFWTFSRSFQSCSNSPIALLFSVGIVVYILVMIYYYPVSCLMIWSVFYIKKSRRSLRNRGERENSKLKLQFFCHNQTRKTRYLFWHWQNGRPFNFTMSDFNRLSQRNMLVLVLGNKFKIDRQQHNNTSTFVSADSLIAKFIRYDASSIASLCVNASD